MAHHRLKTKRPIIIMSVDSSRDEDKRRIICHLVREKRHVMRNLTVSYGLNIRLNTGICIISQLSTIY